MCGRFTSTEDKENENYQDFLKVKQKFFANDKQGRLVFLADSAFSLRLAKQKYPEIAFHYTSEFE
mgnify:FL=1